jgi:hypothetical protein
LVQGLHILCIEQLSVGPRGKRDNDNANNVFDLEGSALPALSACAGAFSRVSHFRKKAL